MNDKKIEPGMKVRVTDQRPAVVAVVVRPDTDIPGIWWCKADEWLCESPISEGNLEVIEAG